MSNGMISAQEARVRSILVMDARTSWPMLMHMSVSDYVVSAASSSGLQEALVKMLRRHTMEMIYYAAAPDCNGVSPSYHIYHPNAMKAKGGGVKAIQYWYGCMTTMLKASINEPSPGPKSELEKKVAKSAAALSHFCADLSNPVHTESEDSVHSAYENWLKNIFNQKDSDQRYLDLHEKLRTQTKSQVAMDRKLLVDVPAAAETELVADANADLARLCELWAAKKASHQTFSAVDDDLITLTAKRFAAGASFTADVWYTAFEKQAGPLPPFDSYLYKLCPDYDSSIKRLDDQVVDMIAKVSNH
jgi:hypothetical protein